MRKTAGEISKKENEECHTISAELLSGEFIYRTPNNGKFSSEILNKKYTVAKKICGDECREKQPVKYPTS
jgi:hypothetical protein